MRQFLRGSTGHFLKPLTHKSQNVDIKFYKELEKSLSVANSMSEKDAVEFLKGKITAISISKLGGFVCQEVQCIIQDPNQLLIGLRDKLREYSHGFDENHRKIMQSFAKELLEDEMPLEFSWEKYLVIRDSMIKLRAQLVDYDEKHLHVDADSYSEELGSESLAVDLEEFYKKNYGAKTVAEKLIEKLSASTCKCFSS